MALTEEQQDTLTSEAAALVQRVVALAKRYQAMLGNAGRLEPLSPVTWRPDAATAVRPCHLAPNSTLRRDSDPEPGG